MRIVPEQILDALAGSNSGASLRCSALYDGEVVASDMAVSSWSVSWRLGDQQAVQGSASFVFEDSGGDLAPWGFDEPLSVGGSRIQAMFECAGESVPFGEWLITSSAPNESWRLASTGSALRWVQGGATIPVGAADLTQLLADSKFMAPESPAGGGTVFSEIRRLCDGIIGVTFDGVTDRLVPKNTVYHEERINTVSDLARMVGEYRVNGDGLLEVFDPTRPAKPMWAIMPGAGGSIVTVNREQSRDGLYNAVVATGQTEDGEELREYATNLNGPLRFDGPAGRLPMDKSSLATTQAGVRQDAETTLATRVSNDTTILSVLCAPNPAYEIGDWGAVAHPMVDGSTFPLVGRCIEVSMSGGPDGMQAMRLAMECSTADVLAVSRYIRSVS